jgi:hypothetical protein
MGSSCSSIFGSDIILDVGHDQDRPPQMASPAKEYQRYASRCLEEARTRSASDPRLKAFLIEMVHAWQRLADQAKVGAIQTPSAEPDRGD